MNKQQVQGELIKDEINKLKHQSQFLTGTKFERLVLRGFYLLAIILWWRK